MSNGFPSEPDAAAVRALPDHAQVVLPPPLIVVLGWGVGWLLERRWPLLWNANPAWAIAGLMLVVAGLAIGASALWTMLAARTSPNPWKPTQAIAMDGPYAFTRNPMYLSFLTLYAGAGLYVRVTWVLILLPFVLVALQQLVIVREEAYLDRKFGASYRDYRRRVRRWV